MYSKHYRKYRKKREKFIKKYINGDGHMIDGFVIDRQHKDGLEVHSITDTGLILIHNYKTGKLCTKLIAKPSQIERYYRMTGREPPPEYNNILTLAKWHEDLFYNLI